MSVCFLSWQRYDYMIIIIINIRPTHAVNSLNAVRVEIGDSLALFSLGHMA